MFKQIEEWASQSDERARLLIIFIWLGFAAAVVVAICVMAVVMLPPEFWTGTKE